jgi:iron complex outermembrane receptor protein
MGSRHELIWGGDYRYSSDTMLNNDYMVMNDPSRQLSYYGLFGQDEITVADTLRLTLGLRMDHSPFTDWESQPTARLAWNLQPTQTLWAAASKAVRAPSRNEIGLNLNFYGEPQTVPPFGSVPVITHLKSDNTFQSEKLVAYEVGLRSQWLSTLSSDVTVFSHQYSNLRIPGTPVLSYAGFPAYIDATIPITNGGELTLNGLELSSDWRPTQDWRFQLSYTYNDVGHVDAAQASASSLVLPENITSLRASWTPTSNTNADLWWRYMGARSSPGFPPAARSGYTSVDLRLGWKPRRNLELALIGQNLSNGECAALDGVALAFENNGSIISCMPRVVGVQARTDF